MRTTLTIDDDLAVLLENENRRAAEPMKQTINRVLRCGLTNSGAVPKRKRFVVKPLDLGTTPEQWERWKSLSAEEILEDMDSETAA